MCLYIKERFGNEAKVAKKNIKVYKKLRLRIKNFIEDTYKVNSDGTILHITTSKVELRSPCRNSLYEIGKLKTACIKKAQYCNYVINNGLHAFVTPNVGNKYSGELFEAIIPKGSKYYLGTDGDIVSNALKVTKLYKPKKKK